jgi:hypothetical protein
MKPRLIASSMERRSGAKISAAHIVRERETYRSASRVCHSSQRWCRPESSLIEGT